MDQGYNWKKASFLILDSFIVETNLSRNIPGNGLFNFPPYDHNAMI